MSNKLIEILYFLKLSSKGFNYFFVEICKYMRNKF